MGVLAKLSFSGIPLDEERLSGLHELRGLQTLAISRTGLTDAASLAQLSRFTQLHALQIHICEIPQSWLPCSGQISKNLEELTLGGTQRA